MGDIVRLPRSSRASRKQADRLRQLALELEWSPEARGELDHALDRMTETPGRRWVFVMIRPEQVRFVTKAVRGCRNVATTLSVWTTALTYLRRDTGEIAATRDQLANDAGTNPDEVSRALGELTKIGAILRHRRARRTVSFVTPQVGWNGGESARQEAAKTAPALRLVDTGPSPAAE